MVLEICVEDLHGLKAAAAGGADRVELCAALDVGGLTPPASLVRASAAAGLPVHLLARPRGGDFCYDQEEAALVIQDIELAAEEGLAGVVVGANTSAGMLDEAMLANWLDHAKKLGIARRRPLSLTLHRAFDLCPDLDEALELAIALGFDRILTSGGVPRAVDALDTLRRLRERADGRIAIMAGSGIDRHNIAAILASGVTEIHASCRRAAPARGDAMLGRFGFAAPSGRKVDAGEVAALRAAMR